MSSGASECANERSRAQANWAMQRKWMSERCKRADEQMAQYSTHWFHSLSTQCALPVLNSMQLVLPCIRPCSYIQTVFFACTSFSACSLPCIAYSRSSSWKSSKWYDFTSWLNSYHSSCFMMNDICINKPCLVTSVMEGLNCRIPWWRMLG